MMAEVAETAEDQAANIDFATYFAMARGTALAPAMEMTKWFDTNYHYIVPEFYAGQEFKFRSRKAIDEFVEAKAHGIHTRPVLIGPVTFLTLGKAKETDVDPLSLLEGLLPVYGEILRGLAEAGADWVQFDEPVLALDLIEPQRAAFKTAYEQLAPIGPKILIASYFGGLGGNLDTVADLPVDGLHVDLVRAPHQIDWVLKRWPRNRVLSLGVIDGRNIWRGDLDLALAKVQDAIAVRGQEGI
jgi:5-methyltetrahydropteroyltriglutamate--homocysteine methyltransferase